MKKIFLICFALCIAFVAKSQELPYSKYFNFTKQEFKDNRFKYDSYTNTWALRKTDKLNATLNVLAIIADAEEEVRPDQNDYSIAVQLGKESRTSYVKVVFYNDETYHKLLAFVKENGKGVIETSSGKIVKHQATYQEYALELNIEQHTITRTSARAGQVLPLTIPRSACKGRSTILKMPPSAPSSRVSFRKCAAPPPSAVSAIRIPSRSSSARTSALMPSARSAGS